MPCVTISRLEAVQRWPVEEERAVDRALHGPIELRVV
jgi:hypothetical protein